MKKFFFNRMIVSCLLLIGIGCTPIAIPLQEKVSESNKTLQEISTPTDIDPAKKAELESLMKKIEAGEDVSNELKINKDALFIKLEETPSEIKDIPSSPTIDEVQGASFSGQNELKSAKLKSGWNYDKPLNIYNLTPSSQYTFSMSVTSGGKVWVGCYGKKSETYQWIGYISNNQTFQGSNYKGLYLIFYSSGGSVINAKIEEKTASQTIDLQYNVSAIQQETDSWCWAASSQMLLKFRGLSYSQESIVQKILGKICKDCGALEEEFKKLEKEFGFKGAVNGQIKVMPTPAEWAKYLKDGGPLIISMWKLKNNVDVIGHATVLKGIKGDFNTPNKIQFIFNDPGLPQDPILEIIHKWFFNKSAGERFLTYEQFITQFNASMKYVANFHYYITYLPQQPTVNF